MPCQVFQWSKLMTCSKLRVMIIWAILNEALPGELQGFLLRLFLEAHGNSWQHLSTQPHCPPMHAFQLELWRWPEQPGRLISQSVESGQRPKLEGDEKIQLGQGGRRRITWVSTVFDCAHAWVLGFRCLRGCVCPGEDQKEAEQQIAPPHLVLWPFWERLDQCLCSYVCCFSNSSPTPTVEQAVKFTVTSLFSNLFFLSCGNLWCCSLSELTSPLPAGVSSPNSVVLWTVWQCRWVGGCSRVRCFLSQWGKRHRGPLWATAMTNHIPSMPNVSWVRP